MANDTLTTIKTVAKQFARMLRQKHIAALETVARELGKSKLAQPR